MHAIGVAQNLDWSLRLDTSCCVMVKIGNMQKDMRSSSKIATPEAESGGDIVM
jgi:hypothetical protein